MEPTVKYPHWDSRISAHIEPALHRRNRHRIDDVRLAGDQLDAEPGWTRNVASPAAANAERPTVAPARLVEWAMPHVKETKNKRTSHERSGLYARRGAKTLE